jgi:hypothetical protein
MCRSGNVVIRVVFGAGQGGIAAKELIIHRQERLNTGGRQTLVEGLTGLLDWLRTVLDSWDGIGTLFGGH